MTRAVVEAAAHSAGAWLLSPPSAGVLQSLPDPLSLEAVAVYAAGLLGLTGLRYLLKRWQRSKAGATVDVSDLLGEEPITHSGPGTTVRTAEPADGPDHVIDRSRGGPTKKSGVAFTLPAALPLSEGVRQVTHNEVHAIELGLVVGLALGWLHSVGELELTVSILAVFVAGALGYKRYRSKAFETVRYEPWYGLVAVAAGAGLGYLVFGPGIALPALVLY